MRVNIVVSSVGGQKKRISNAANSISIQITGDIDWKLVCTCVVRCTHTHTHALAQILHVWRVLISNTRLTWACLHWKWDQSKRGNTLKCFSISPLPFAMMCTIAKCSNSMHPSIVDCRLASKIRFPINLHLQLQLLTLRLKSFTHRNMLMHTNTHSSLHRSHRVFFSPDFSTSQCSNKRAKYVQKVISILIYRCQRHPMQFSDNTQNQIHSLFALPTPFPSVAGW